MIFGNVGNLKEFPYLEEQVQECFAYFKSHNMADYEKGCHEIDGRKILGST